MALDAFVYCDCFEKDNLRCNPPGGLKLKIAANGDVTCDAPSDHDWFAFTAWKQGKACAHDGMILKHHRLGTSKILDPLRAELEKEHADRFPILLQKVLYSSTHTCDWIPLKLLPKLTDELKQLNPHGTHSADALRHLKIQLAELIIAAQMAHKPICF
jgi:hypothetical protein